MKQNKETQEIRNFVSFKKETEVLFFEEKDMKIATFGDLLDAGWDDRVLNIECIDEEKNIWLDKCGEGEELPYKELMEKELDYHYCVTYHDGKNTQRDIYDENSSLDFFPGIITQKPHPSPAYYFVYEIENLNTGEKFEVVQNNVSGSLSPYFILEVE